MRGSNAVQAAAPDVEQGSLVSMDDLLITARGHADDWNTITMNLPEQGANEISFRLDAGSGRQPQYQDTLTLSATSGAIAGFQAFGDRSPGRQARSWVRFLHTGEAFGFIGQTIAGLVSLTSVFMVWTGLALAWRRIVTPLIRRKVGHPLDSNRAKISPAES